MIGSIIGVRLIIDTFPEVGWGPRLNIHIHGGAMTEGILTFTIVIISLGLATKIPESFFMKTWISSVSRLALHILGSDLTGGCMNPATVSTISLTERHKTPPELQSLYKKTPELISDKKFPELLIFMQKISFVKIFVKKKKFF